MKNLFKFGAGAYFISLASGLIQFVAFWLLEKRLPLSQFSELSTVFSLLTSCILLIEFGLAPELLRRINQKTNENIQFFQTSTLLKFFGATAAILISQLQFYFAGASFQLRAAGFVLFLTLFPMIPLQTVEFIGLSDEKIFRSVCLRLGRIFGWILVILTLFLTQSLVLACFWYLMAFVILNFIFKTDLGLSDLYVNLRTMNARSLFSLSPWALVVILQFLQHSFFMAFALKLFGQKLSGTYYFASSLCSPLSILIGLVFQLAWKEVIKGKIYSHSGLRFSRSFFIPFSLAIIFSVFAIGFARIIFFQGWFIKRTDPTELFREFLPLCLSQIFMISAAFFASFFQAKKSYFQPIITAILPLISLFTLANFFPNIFLKFGLGWTFAFMGLLSFVWMFVVTLMQAKSTDEAETK